MKKTLSLLLSVVFVVSLLAGCGNGNTEIGRASCRERVS